MPSTGASPPAWSRAWVSGNDRGTRSYARRGALDDEGGPAVWSVMLAARARGLGTCWTTMHMPRERDAAELLGIPYDTTQQVCLTPLAYTLGTDFKPAHPDAPETYIHWDRWDPAKPVPAPWAGFANSTQSNRSEDEMTDPQ